MNIDRVWLALKRSTHYNDRELAHNFPEIEQLKEDSYLELLRWEVVVRRHSILGYCFLNDRRFIPIEVKYS